ncbi:MAG: hypothetical protein JW726_15220 [Anaerolineales bacterium]|nr:hypothetical protein [Anaerolineales bacterium]
MSRWVKFLIAIGLGAAAGLYFGWVINPVEYVDAAPDALRVDYKADYVLMVAEAYSVENDLGLAVRRLALLGDTAPQELVKTAIEFAIDIEFYEPDIALMEKLALDLQSWDPALEVPGP